MEIDDQPEFEGDLRDAYILAVGVWCEAVEAENDPEIDEDPFALTDATESAGGIVTLLEENGEDISDLPGLDVESCTDDEVIAQYQ